MNLLLFLVLICISSVVRTTDPSSDSKTEIEWECADEQCEEDGYCEKESCAGSKNSAPPIEAEKSTQLDEEVATDEFSNWPNVWRKEGLMFLTVVVVLLFSIGYYYIEHMREEKGYIAQVNKLANEVTLMVLEKSTLEKENDQLKSQVEALLDENDILKRSDSETNKELDMLKEEKTTVERKLMEQIMIVEALMQEESTLFDELGEEEGNLPHEEKKTVKLAEVKQVELLSKQLVEKEEEVKLLKINLETANEKIGALERNLAASYQDTQNQIKQTTQKLKEKVTKLEEELREKCQLEVEICSELDELKEYKEKITARCEVAEESLKEAHGVNSKEEILSRWLETKEVRVKLAMAEKTVVELQENIKLMSAAQRDSSTKLSKTALELEQIKTKLDAAEKEKSQALIKLKILSDHFKEKEKTFQEELSTKEKEWQLKENEGHDIYEQMKLLKEEVSIYKTQIELLKKEILDQESCYKRQIADEEKKTEENWVAFRQIERRLKETQKEAAYLRKRLTALEKADMGDDKLDPNGMEANGGEGFVMPPPPAFMIPPPDYQPSDFPPPTLPLPQHTPTRPPPLGRISSPPLDLPPPLIPYDMFSPPSPPFPIHKPRQKKESLSSNYSSESLPDNPKQRKSKR